MTTLGLDLRFALRTYRRHAVTTALAIVTLALGIGLNTAIFSLVHAILLKPLPYPQADRLIDVSSSAPKFDFPLFSVSGPDLQDWQARAHTTKLAAYYRMRENLGGIDQPRSVQATSVSGSFFGVMGVQPRLGRFVTAEDCRAGAHVVVLAEGFWRSVFAADPRVIGRTIHLDGESVVVVGVAPERLDLPPTTNVWLPMADKKLGQFRGSRYLKAVGRMAAGTTIPQVQAELVAISAALERQYPNEDSGWTVVVRPLAERFVESVRPALTVLSLAVWLVLAIACANVAGLLLARLAARSQELAVRSALGAGARRLTLQVMVECVALFVAGGALGLVVATTFTRWLGVAAADALPRIGDVGVDGQVLAYCAAIALGVSILVGLVVARAALADNVASTLREARRGGAAGSSRRIRRGLVIAEVALALTLLCGAGLLVRSLLRLSEVDPGFRTAGVTTLPFSLWSSVGKTPAGSSETEEERGAALLARVRGALGALPGVRHVAAMFPLPLSGQDQFDSFVFEDRPLPGAADTPHSAASFVTPDTFDTLRIPLLEGRDFGAQDTVRTAPVVIVNRTFANQFWPSRDAVGQRVSFDLQPKTGVRSWSTVVGVVGDVRSDDLSTAPESTIYRSLLQVPNSTTLLVASDGPATALSVPLEKTLRAIVPDLPLDRVAPLASIADASVSERRLRTILLVGFAALAALLAGIGLYGLLSDLVAQRTHEVGVRMALGAARGQVLRLVLREGMTMVGWGLALGLAGSFALARVLESQLFAVGVADPTTWVAAVLVLVVVALLANWFPARRATEVDPIEALRAE